MLIYTSWIFVLSQKQGLIFVNHLESVLFGTVMVSKFKNKCFYSIIKRSKAKVRVLINLTDHISGTHRVDYIPRIGLKKQGVPAFGHPIGIT